MNEAEASAMRDIVEAAVRKIFDEKVTSACTDLKASIRTELEPIRKALEELKDLPGAIRTLQDQWLKLTASVEPLRPLPTLIDAHREEMREFRIKLGYLQGLEPKLKELGILVPVATAKIEAVFRDLDAISRQVDSNHESMKGEIERVERESQRVAGSRP
jgi:hypothetical protein